MAADSFFRWLIWRWHLLRYRGRGATWFAVHSYGCDFCEDR